MSVDEQTTMKMAKAAHIMLSPDETKETMQAINDILDFCALVGELDTSGTPDFTWSMKMRMPRRADEVTVWDGRDAFMSQAPTAEGDLFRVPRIIAEE